MHIYILFNRSVYKFKRKSFEGKVILSVFFHDPGKELFEQIIRWFLKEGFHFISVEELYDILIYQKEFPKGAVVLTVDDGWKGNKKNIADIADKYGIPVRIFLNTSPIINGDRYWVSYLREAQKAGITTLDINSCKKLPNKELQEQISIWRKKIPSLPESMSVEEITKAIDNGNVSYGAHTMHHPFLTSCTDQEAHVEIAQSGEQVAEWTHKKTDSFAYPFGAHSEREVALLKKLNYKIAFSTIPDYIQQNNVDLFRLPRFEVMDPIGFQENIYRMTGVWHDAYTKIKKAKRFFKA